jgi:hypothetical protein
MRRPRAAANRAKSTRRRFIAACFAFGVVAGGVACNPRFNWREFRSPYGFTVVLPGRPQTVSREITLPDAKVQMSMTSTGIGATLFAVGAAELPSGLSADLSARQRAVTHLRDALVRNVNGSLSKSSVATLSVPAGDSRKVLTAEAIEATGRDSSGRAVQLAARLFIVDDRLFQVVALGAEGEIPPEALDTFFASFRLI